MRLRSPQQTLIAVLDRAIARHADLVPGHVERMRRRHPGDSPTQLLARLEQQYLTAVTAAGAAVGAGAAVPAVGVPVALALNAAEFAAFVEASALLVLAAAEVHGVGVNDVERRRTLLMTVLLGRTGRELFAKATGKTDRAWAKLLPAGVTAGTVEGLNRRLGRWFVARYGSKQGATMIGRLAPFGVGAAVGGAANAALGRGVVSATRQAFGPAPERFPPGVVRGTTVEP